MRCWAETAVMNFAFFCKTMPVKPLRSSFSNLPGFQRHSHAMGKNIHFIFLLDMRNIRTLHQTVYSSCAVQMRHFMKLSSMEKMDVWHTKKDFNQEFASSLDLHLRISLNTFRVHLLFTKRIKKRMSFSMQTMSFSI